MVVKIVRVLNRLGVVNNGHFKVLVTECLVPSLLETQCLWFLLGFFNFFLEKLFQHVQSWRTVTPGIHDSERSLSVVITVVEHAFEFRTQIEDKKKDIEVKEKIFRNIEGHAAIIKGKSERMAKRLQTATARFGSPRRRMTNK